MKKKFLRRLVAMIALLLAGGSTQAFATATLIGNPGIAHEKLDASTVKAVFLGKKVAWDSAGRITLAVLKGGPVADEFLKGAVDMNSSAFNNHWRRLAMTGGGTAPKTFDKEEELRKFVSETAGAIGFIDSANVDDSVVVLKPGS